MNKSIKFLVLISIIIFGITSDFINTPIDTRSVEQKIMESVVKVKDSSGIVIYSEDNRAIVLTAYHTISNACKAEVCDYDLINVQILHSISTAKSTLVIPIMFDVTNIASNIRHDLSLIEIKTNRKINSMTLYPNEPIKYGKEIYIAGNPIYLFRSLKKGIISAPFRIINNSPVFEVDAGIIFGASGGGVFTLDGKLIGIAVSIRNIISKYCYDIWDDEGDYIGQECVEIPLPFIGFARRPEVIKNFIRDSIFCKDFNYQCIDDSTETMDD